MMVDEMPAVTGASLKDMSVSDLLELWAGVMAELRKRNVIRSANNPVADYSEHLVAVTMGLSLETNSTASFDARDAAGRRYQIKARRLTGHKSSRQLGAIRNLDGFDVLVVVLFDNDFRLNGIWTVPIELVREKAVYQKHTNSYIVHAQPSLLSDPLVSKIA